MYKKSYFQGGSNLKEPTKKSKINKSLVEPRFKEPFYSNYDAYETESGPGAGWNDMHKYKSISEFLAAKRKRMNKNIRARILNQLTKNAIDFMADKYVDFIYPQTNPVGQANSIGVMDNYIPNNDLEDKPATDLDFSRVNKSPLTLDQLMDKYLGTSNEYGIPGGVTEEITEEHNPYFGTTDLGIDIYQDKWNI